MEKRLLRCRQCNELVLFTEYDSSPEYDYDAEKQEFFEEPRDDGYSQYIYLLYDHFDTELSRHNIKLDTLKTYDENISRHTQKINSADRTIKWKYFQYLALLFTEIYLDRYFNDRENFCNELNLFLGTFNKENSLKIEEKYVNNESKST